MLRRVAEILGAKIHVEIRPEKRSRQPAVAEKEVTYGNNRK